MKNKEYHVNKFHINFGHGKFRKYHTAGNTITAGAAFSVSSSDQDRACILLLRLQGRGGHWLWAHCVLQVRDNLESSQHPVIICTCQVLRSVVVTLCRICTCQVLRSVVVTLCRICTCQVLRSVAVTLCR